mgnify:CR=1 FL=1
MEFVKFYNAKTALEDIEYDLGKVRDTLKELDEYVARLSNVAKVESRMLKLGAGGGYGKLTYSHLNFTVKIHLMSPTGEVLKDLSEVRRYLAQIEEALAKAREALKALGDEYRGLSMIGVAIDNGEVKLLLIA